MNGFSRTGAESILRLDIGTLRDVILIALDSEFRTGRYPVCVQVSRKLSRIGSASGSRELVFEGPESK